jgi:C-terminal processing protease CtpA/Prc
MVRELPGAYSGIVPSTRDSGLVIREVDWNSPAWNQGLRARNKIIEIEGTTASPTVLNEVMKTKQAGHVLKLVIDRGKGNEQLSLELGTKREKSFTITPVSSPDALQAAIYQSWRQPPALH